MKPVEKNKTQKLVRKIETGHFDENDIDSLFMKLRAYSTGFPIFREVADFVAHNDQRNRGLVNQSLETMYLRMQYFLEYNSPEKTLDLSSPFPIWIKNLMKLQVGKCDEADLRSKFNVTKQRLADHIDSAFREDKKNKVAIYKQGKLSQNIFNAIQHVMSFISGNATFGQDELLDELVSVLKKNQIEFNESVLRELSDKVTICTLLLFHHSDFDFKMHKPGRCEISSEKESISHNVKFVDIEGNEVEHDESFGNLSVKGIITLEKDEINLSIAHTIMSTNLSSEIWCSDELFHIESLSEEMPNYMCKRLKLDIDLCINEDFQLSVVST
jgi:hypothetical protein